MSRKRKVVDVNMQVTCLASDVAVVRQELRHWFNSSETAMCHAFGTGGVTVSKPYSIPDEMKECLTPEDC